jgi:subtilisin family serine protease
MAYRQRRATLRTTLLAALLSVLTPAITAGAGPRLAEAAPTADGRSAVGVDAAAVPSRLGEVARGALTKIPARLAQASGRISVFVELAKRPAADAYRAALPGGREAARQAARLARQDAGRTATAVVGQLRTSDRSTSVLYRTSNSIAGVAVVAEAASLRELAARPDVASIAPLVPKRLDNASAAVLTEVLDSWQDLGLFGDGIEVGVIDTGVDYTHANFGGPGTPEAFDAIDPTVIDPSYFPTAKVVGGTDFAGENYDADSDDPAEATPDPDPNPLDCDGHGSHVAGTAAGFGVNADGSTFDGDYSALTADALDGMRIGPGMAPKASIYALKVFGCPTGEAGSTGLVAAALDWTLDPDGDGDFGDHLDVVNISIGADYSAPDDPDVRVARRIINHGVMPVFSAGNGGDFYDIGSEAPEALSVASTRDAFVLRDAIEVTAPPDVAGIKGGQYSIAFDYVGFDMTDDVINLTEADNLDGCDPLSAEDVARVTGRIAWLEWDDNDATRRCGSAVRSANVAEAGATGALFTSELEHFTAGITGSSVIPVFQMTGTVTDELRPAMEAGTLVVRMAGELANSLETRDPAIEDTPSSFTSRGTRSPGVKPDIAAPGDTIVSTGIGTGNGVTSISGTSMASPHVAGIAALVRQAHPSWTPTDVKAALMNTANHDVFSQDGPAPPIHAPNRVGAGRVNARDALGNEIIAFDQKEPGIVSVGFGVVEVANPLTRSRTIKLVNKGSSAASYDVAYQPITEVPGVVYELDRSSVTVPALGSATVRVGLRISNPAALRKTADPTIEKFNVGLPRQFLADASGRVVFSPTSGATVPLRVPLYSAPKPVAAIQVPSRLRIPDSTGTLTLSGKGLNQGTGDQRYLSLISVLELAATSPRLPKCSATVTADCAINHTARGGDLRYVGVGSTAPAAVAAGSPASALLGFGIATWSNWYNIGSNTIPFVDIDVDGDLVADYETAIIRDVDTDLLEAWTFSLAAGFPVVDIQPVNQLYGDVDSNVFDANVILMPVLLAALGIDPSAESARINFFLGVDGFYEAPDSTLVDFIPTAMTFDPVQPGLWAEGADPSLMFVAQPGASFNIHRDSESLALDGSNSLLVLNFHNRTGERERVVTIRN